MTYKYEPHAFYKRKFLPWLICAHCGLIALNNAFTRWAIEKGCDNDNHPDFARKRKELSK